jgi:P4 family phage/plasmid primase-like protien
MTSSTLTRTSARRIPFADIDAETLTGLQNRWRFNPPRNEESFKRWAEREAVVFQEEAKASQELAKLNKEAKKDEPRSPLLIPLAEIEKAADAAIQRNSDLSTALMEATLVDEIAPLAHKVLVYVFEWETWAVYKKDTGLWKHTKGKPNMLSLVKAYVQTKHRLLLEADTKPSERKKAVLATLLSNHKINGVTNLLLNDASFIVNSDIFDTNLDVLLVGNATVVDLKTGKARPAKPDDFFTKRTDVTWNPKAGTKDLHALLNALPKDERDYLVSIVGQALTGHQLDPGRALFLNGEGSNGKSSLLALFGRVFGDYGDNPMPKTLLKDTNAPDHIWVVFNGLRCAFFDELPDSRFLDAFVIKRLVNSPKMRAADKYERAQSFTMRATNLIATNHLPSVAETEDGTWRRLRVLHFPYTYKKHPDPSNKFERQADVRLSATAITDMKPDEALLQSALYLLVKGAVEWYKGGRETPDDTPAVAAASAEWRGDTDRLAEWADSCVEAADEASFTLVDDLYESYKRYAAQSGYGNLSRQAFVSAVKRHRWFAAYEVKKTRISKGMRQNVWSNPDEDWKERYHPRGYRGGDIKEFIVAGVRLV